MSVYDINDDLIGDDVEIEGNEQITLEEKCSLLNQQTNDPEVNQVHEQETVVLMDDDNLSCDKCEYEAEDSFHLKNHKASKHVSRISDEDIQKVLTAFSVKNANI